MRDISPSRLASEVAYFSRRYPREDLRVLEANRKDNYCGRDFYHTKDFSDDFHEFMCSKPGQDGKNAKKLDAGEVCELCEKPLPFEVYAYEVDHSIYGATAYVLEGDTAIAYSGDLRVHGKKGEETKDFVRSARDASVLIIEGTRAGREDYHDSEGIVYENCRRVVEQTDELVIADFAARNFERMEAFAEIAEKCSRELVITAKDAYMLHAIECADGIHRMKDLRIYEELRAKKDKWEVEVVEERWGDRYTSPSEISENPELYILCFSFYDLKHLLDIKPEGGAYVYSSSEAFSEEQEFDFVRLNNWLSRFYFETYGFRIEGDKPVFEKGYHASGHASKDDLRWIIETVDPDVVIPVHTDNSGWFEKEFENVVVLGDGESYKLG
jgi:ribonuclease J